MSRIFPAIDIMNGLCVRLTEGREEAQTKYDVSPLEMAKRYEASGAKYLHIVDLDAALNKGNNYNLVKQIVKNTSLKIELGGGIRSTNQVDEILDLGVSQIIIGSTAVKNPNLVKEWIVDFGPQKIVIGADTKDGKIAINGWKELSALTLYEFISNFSEASAQKFLCTDITKDGKLQGSAVELYSDLQKWFPKLDFIASGGVSTLEEVNELRRMKMYGIIVGKAIYEGAINLEKLFI
jgi:phosphoribosylformimino-5-aminoimidazole carboxamide ribotide isomerase